MKFIRSSIVALSLVLGVTAAHADPRIGLLTCHITGSHGDVVSSVQNAHCVFTGLGHREHYTARLHTVGLDVGVREGGFLTWAVVAPSGYYHRALRGQYVGASANASVGIGAGANALIGGNDRTISLQPVSLEAHTGLNLAVGVSELQVR